MPGFLASRLPPAILGMVGGRRAQDSAVKECVRGTFLIAMTKFLARSSMRKEKVPVAQGVSRLPPSRWGRHGDRDSVQVGRTLLFDHICVAEHGKEWSSGSSPFNVCSSSVLLLSSALS